MKVLMKTNRFCSLFYDEQLEMAALETNTCIILFITFTKRGKAQGQLNIHLQLFVFPKHLFINYTKRKYEQLGGCTLTD